MVSTPYEAAQHVKYRRVGVAGVQSADVQGTAECPEDVALTLLRAMRMRQRYMTAVCTHLLALPRPA